MIVGALVVIPSPLNGFRPPEPNSRGHGDFRRAFYTATWRRVRAASAFPSSARDHTSHGRSSSAFLPTHFSTREYRHGTEPPRPRSVRTAQSRRVARQSHLHLRGLVERHSRRGHHLRLVVGERRQGGAGTRAPGAAAA